MFENSLFHFSIFSILPVFWVHSFNVQDVVAADKHFT